ncbi:unnamed protein product [Caenorhabditis auriculariae]|uniref:Uncharacterized protein n=1 Tax=Caenorhabditis auriculariae TaxID=2777116 RepID=A0A8S1GNL4_9PELO|nr:unnamed protein product [Caenorhabditis auriculariae]
MGLARGGNKCERQPDPTYSDVTAFLRGLLRAAVTRCLFTVSCSPTFICTPSLLPSLSSPRQCCNFCHNQSHYAMELGVLETKGQIGVRCKLLMNILRRAFSFRDKRNAPESSSTTTSIELTEPSAKRRVSSLAGSDIASTSRESFNLVPDAPSVYEDPFVAVTADGCVHVKYYYTYNPRTEFRMEDVHLPHMKKLRRTVRICQLRTIFYASPMESRDSQTCKTWGMSRNDVWWASHLNRQEEGNLYSNVVLDDGTTIRAGFTVINLDAFAESLQYLGLSQEVPFQHGLPSPPFNLMQIPFIDEEPELESEEQAGPSRISSPASTSSVRT